MSETNEEILAEIRDDLKNRLGIGNYAIQRLLDMYDELQASHLPSPPEPGKGAKAAAAALWLKTRWSYRRDIEQIIAAHTTEPSEHERVVGQMAALLALLRDMVDHPDFTNPEGMMRTLSVAIAVCNPTEQEPTDA